jgi:hypothetical protein
MRITMGNRLGTELSDVETIGGRYEGTPCELQWEPWIRGNVNGNVVGNVMKDVYWNVSGNSMGTSLGT